jgi:Fe-S-cluster containining protein
MLAAHACYPRRVRDEEELGRLMERLTAQPEYALGTRRFAGPVSDEDAAEIAEAMQRELSRGLEKREELARRKRLRIVCERGCNVCCEELVIVYLPEALAVARWLESAAGAQARAQFLDKYPRWRAAAGDGPEREAELNADWQRRAEYEVAHKEQWKKRVMCAFNHDGACSIYPVRPMLCREGHAVDTNARCCVDVALVDPPRRLTFAPVEDFMSRANVLMRSAHNAIAGNEKASTRVNRAEALCELVYRLISS